MYKGIQNSLHEAGLYSLVLKSRKPNAKEITDWITEEVIPSIRETGEYILNDKFKKEIEDLNDKLTTARNELSSKQNEVDILHHDMKKQSYPKGNVMYMIRVINDSLDLNPNEVIDIKFGISNNFDARKNTLDTTTKHRTQVLKIISVKNAKLIEDYVKEKLSEYRIKRRKEYFTCSFNQMITIVAACIKFIENRDIDIALDLRSIRRAGFDEF